jgi:hypothetical protein
MGVDCDAAGHHQLAYIYFGSPTLAKRNQNSSWRSRFLPIESDRHQIGQSVHFRPFWPPRWRSLLVAGAKIAELNVRYSTKQDNRSPFGPVIILPAG